MTESKKVDDGHTRMLNYRRPLIEDSRGFFFVAFVVSPIFQVSTSTSEPQTRLNESAERQARHDNFLLGRVEEH